MNREILFRAWHTFQTEAGMIYSGWEYGYYFNNYGTDGHSIYLANGKGSRIVDKNSICQFTGLHDKNGTAIFEGDLVRSYLIDDGDSIDTVIFDSGAFMLSSPNKLTYPMCEYDKQYLEVIGNIFSNPELLTQ